MNLKELKVTNPDKLVGKTLVAVIPDMDGTILLFEDACVALFGADIGYEQEPIANVNHNFNPIEHHTFFHYAGLITEDEDQAYCKEQMELAQQQMRERDLEQLARLKRQYETANREQE